MNHHATALWGAIIVSVIVLIGFATMCTLVFTRAIPSESMDLAKDVAKTMGVLVVGVVGFWTGSSMGSLQKTSMLGNTEPK